MLFAGNAVDFVRMFIFKERGTRSDRNIMALLTDVDCEEAFSKRIHESNKSTYVEKVIMDVVKANPDLIRFLYQLFEAKFDPGSTKVLAPEELTAKEVEFSRILESRFMDYPVGYDIFKFMLLQSDL